MDRRRIRALAPVSPVALKMRIEANFNALLETTWQEYTVRFLFGGAITTIAGIVAKEFGPGVAGLFLAFPAIFPASATMLEKHEKEKPETQAGKEHRASEAVSADASGAATGSIGLAAFAVTAWRLFHEHSSWLTLLAATLTWLAVGFLTWELRSRLVAKRRSRQRN